MIKFFKRELFYDVSGVFLVAVLPLVIFLKHSGYSLHAPEVLAIFSLILAFAFLCGLLMIPGQAPVRVLIFTALAVLLVDIQTDWITTLGLRLLLNLVFFGTLFWLLRRRLTGLVPALAGVMVLSTVFLPGGQWLIRDGQPGTRPEDDPNLPFILHLVLDEQMGVEGIPLEFDQQGVYAGGMRDFYLDNSFALFGRAYSRYYNTHESMPNLLNFSAAADLGHFLAGKFEQGIVLEKNSWFDLLHARGYRINMVESSFMSYFRKGSGEGTTGPDTRLSYTAATLKPIESADLTVSQKIPFVLSTYFTQSYFLAITGGVFTGMASSPMGKTLGLPSWNLHGNYPGALAVMQVLDELEVQLQGAGPGQAFFAHIMMPHAPYGFDRDCRMELNPGKWLYSADKSLVPRINTAASRAERYPLYLEQMMCLQGRLETMFRVLRDKGLWDDAVIVIHGDHGSRICQWAPDPTVKDNLSPSDFVDSFSTLFAVKSPAVEAGYHDQLLPIDHLFTRMMRDGELPGDSELEAHPTVFLTHKDQMMEMHAMPPFSNGKPQATTP